MERNWCFLIVSRIINYENKIEFFLSQSFEIHNLKHFLLKRNSLNNRKSEFHPLALLHKFKIARTKRNIIRQFDHSFLEKWYPRKITDNPYTILKKEKERERTFEPSYFHESFRNRNRDAAAGIGVEGRTILLDWDEGFKQGIKKEERIGARSLDGFKSLRSWKYVSFPSPSLLPPRKWKDTNVSREPVNSSRGSQSRPRSLGAVQYKCKLEQIRVWRGTRRRNRSNRTLYIHLEEAPASWNSLIAIEDIGLHALESTGREILFAVQTGWNSDPVEGFRRSVVIESFELPSIFFRL